jgi:hypothetical protein
MKNETYCPCCASDYTEFQQTNHINNRLIEVFECNYCGSTFENVYRMETQKVTKHNSEVMYMLRAKEIVETELRALGDNITNSRSFADGRIYMLLDMLIDELNDWESKRLVEIYKSSSFHREYEETSK